MLMITILGLLALFTLALILYRRWEPSGWYIGPRIHGKNKSLNLPLYPKKLPGYEWVIELTNPKQDLHYVTRSVKNFHEVKAIRVKVGLSGKFIQTEDPSQPAAMSLIVIAKGEDWSGKPTRWYLPFIALLDEWGTHDLTYDVNDPAWRSVLGDPVKMNNIERVGVVFGGSNGLGHGVHTNSTAKIELYNFDLIR